MSDVIRLLPESVANQIAAGEVVQRPASVVKELLENALDAGAKSIKLTIKESGKSFIQIVDDGKGMSDTDARLCFERHATSKIKEAKDLFSIRTMGFRGEALASIASVASVELRTRQQGDETGTLIIIEGGELITQEPVATSPGTSIIVKNLFFNIPVRKNFLKSNNVEYKQIVEELIHVAMAFPEISFIMSSEKVEIYHLIKGSLRNRIIGIFGKKYDNYLVPVNEDTPLVRISGFVGKPDAAKKTRGEQYFFVNKRFIRNPFFNHAVVNAFEGLIPGDSFPFYVLFFEIPYEKVDVNVHPTKTEVKFEEEKEIYMILKATVKKVLGQVHFAPTLDFEHESFLNNLRKLENDKISDDLKLRVNVGTSSPSGRIPIPSAQKSSEKDWKELLKILNHETEEKVPRHEESMQHVIPGLGVEKDYEENFSRQDNKLIQVHQKYIFTSIHSGIMLIHQQYAHQRVLFEEFMQNVQNKDTPSQKQIFPEAIEFTEGDFQIMNELKPLLEKMGFMIEEFGKRTYLFNGIPTNLKQINSKEFIEELLEEYKSNLGNVPSNPLVLLAQSMACRLAIKAGEILDKEEMSLLIDKLFACENPYYSPKGKPVFMKIDKSELDKKFE